MTVDTILSETDVAADVLHLLRKAGAIAPAANRPEHLCTIVGVTPKDLALAAHRAERHGLDSLKARDVVTIRDPRIEDEHGLEFVPPVNACPDPSAHDDPPPRAPREASAHPGERQCPRCREWWPVEEFVERNPDDPRPLDGVRRTMCRSCFGEYERGHFIAVRRADPIEELRVFFTSTAGDGCVGMTCAACGDGLELGQSVTVRGFPVHTVCPKGES